MRPQGKKRQTKLHNWDRAWEGHRYCTTDGKCGSAHGTIASGSILVATRKLRLAFDLLLRLCGNILSFSCGVILIVARHSFRNLFRGELAMILGMQNFGGRARIRVHCLNAPYSLEVDIVATPKLVVLRPSGRLRFGTCGSSSVWELPKDSTGRPFDDS